MGKSGLLRFETISVYLPDEFKTPAALQKNEERRVVEQRGQEEDGLSKAVHKMLFQGSSSKFLLYFFPVS